MMHWWFYNGWWSAAGPWMMLMMLVFWAAVIVGIVLLVKWLVEQPTASTGTRRQSPLDILNERYARGELTPDQYQQMRRDLEHPRVLPG
jgi:putative membrane protein